jgi:glycine/D-amino acid oxidase-like deaminating enzyme
MSKHYDVVVLGGSLGALTCAALLARRSWRVLVLGQGRKPAFYTHDDLTLARRTFTLLAYPSPAWGRVLVELAQSQTFRRRALPVEPMFQVLGPGVRLDVPPDANAFGAEVDREFGEVRRVVDALYEQLAAANAAADDAFGRDLVWPAGSFWERRETARAAETLPFLGAHISDPLAEFPRDHAYRAVVEATARFASDRTGALPPFALARLHGAWTRGVARLAGGEDELTDFLLERVRAHGGETRVHERATALVTRGSRVTGVQVDGEEGPVGAHFLVADAPASELLQLAPKFLASRRLPWPRVVRGESRYVVSAVVRDEGLPAMLGTESFLVPTEPMASAFSAPDNRAVGVHLQKFALGDGGAGGRSLLVAETLLAREGGPPVARARELVLATVETFLPFVQRHYLFVDSPHDGRPAWDYRSGTRVEVDRTALRPGGGSVDVEAMTSRWDIADDELLEGLGGEPLRTALSNAFVVGSSVLPALGQEGELLAAWSVARIITRTDRRREKMRRDMWSKVELG